MSEKSLQKKIEKLEKILVEKEKQLNRSQKNETKFREIFEKANDGIFLWELDEKGMPGRCIEVNEVACEKLGYSKEEILSLTPFEIKSMDSVLKIPAIMEELHRNSRARFTINNKSKDGESIPVEINSHLFELDNKKVILSITRDLRERFETEEALKTSEERLKLALDGTKAGLWDWNISTGEKFYSRQWSDMLGYEPEDLKNKDSFWESLVHPDDYKNVVQLLHSHLEGNSDQYIAEYRILAKSGDWKWILDSGKVVERDETGKPLRAAGTHLDISQRKMIEEQILQSEHKFKAIFDYANDAIFLMDGEKFIDCNQKTVEIFGYSKEEILGKKPYDLSPLLQPGGEDSKHAARGKIKDALNGKPQFFEWTHQRADKTYIDVEVSLNRISVNEKTLIQAIVHDITHRKEAERALYERTMQYESFIRNSLVGIWRVEFKQPIPITLPDREIAERILSNGYFSECNDAFLEMYNSNSRDDFIGRSIRGGSVDNEKSLKRLEIFVKNGFKIVLIDNEEYDKNGKLKFFRNSYIGFVEDEYLLWMWGVQIDITEQRRLETQFRQSQKMEAVGMLAGGIAHDFNNLLTVINGYSEIIISRIDKENPIHKHINSIKTAGERAATLTGQLLAFSRKQILQPKVLKLNTIVRNLEKMLKRLIREDITLTTELCPSLWSIKSDPGQLEQILINLIVNARDAMPEGGNLIIETKNIVLDEKFIDLHPGSKTGSFVVLSIKDTGIGMDKETQLRIFEPFFTTKEKATSTGLGLATVYGIVKQSNGYISVDSEPGKGSTFSMYLPRVSGGKYEDIKETTETDISFKDLKGTETILVVEDEERVLQVVSDTLSSLGYTVLEAANGDHASFIFEETDGPIHMVLTDVIMPKLNGQELVELLQADRPDLKVLFMSGYTDDAILQHGVLGKNTNFIHKPFTPRDLALKVRDVLDG
ncbi:MAG: PAS domain S-box protein [Calditrichaceae bacterium]